MNIKECKVILHNSAVSVVKFEDIEIQFPATDMIYDGKVYVECNGGRYTIVEKVKFTESLELLKTKSKSKSSVKKVEIEMESVEDAIK